jgi:hypothetical protein
MRSLMGLLDAFQFGEALRLPFLHATTGSNTSLTSFSSTHSSGIAHQLHYLDVSDEICKSRLVARNASGEHPFQTSATQYELITR